MVRAPTETNEPPPPAILSIVTLTETSVLVEDTDSSAIRGPAPAVASWIWPAPLVTENRLAVPYRVQAPPLSALPQPLLAVRENASVASGPVGATVVTVLVTLSVAPSSSVTVSFTV